MAFFELQLTAESLGLTARDMGLRTWRAIVAEFIATALFIFIGAGTVVTVTGVLGLSPYDDAAALVAIALAHGLAIALLVAATAKISGGHINPAVTFAAVLTGRTKVAVGVLYVLAQIAGAVMGAILIKVGFADDVEGHLGAHAMGPGVATAELGFVVEMVLTFVLVFTVFATAMDPRRLSDLAPAAIGLAVLVDHLIGVPLTGASMNPARSFGPAAIANFWDDHWVYWVGPLAGGGLAGLLYYSLYLSRPDEG